MKLEIDVAGLFAKIDPRYKFISFDRQGLYAFVRKPYLDGTDEFCAKSGGTGLNIREVPVQLFERPVPSAWKRVEDCNLDRLVNVLYKWSDTGFCGVVDVEGLRVMASGARAHRYGLTWCEIPK